MVGICVTSRFLYLTKKNSPGGPGHTVFASFSAAVFVAGGSGITYALSAIEDLVQKDIRGESRVKVIELVWSVSDPGKRAPQPCASFII